MKNTTSHSFDGYKITQYYGVVNGETILGINVFKDFFAGVRDVVGGRSKTYENELKEARRLAFEEMNQEAKSLSANAVIGIDVDYETIGGKGSMLMVSVSGTAVHIEPLE